MEDLVQLSLKTVGHLVEQQQVKVTVGTLPAIAADQASMEQIVGHILTNAVIYLDPDRPGKIKINGERNYHETLYHIRDNGRGISAEYIHRVFELFCRADNHEVAGEGLGLAYTRTLVRRHDGRIWCDSKPGVGTTFTFTISNHLKRGVEGLTPLRGQQSG